MWSRAMNSGAMVFVGHPHNAYLQAVLDMGLIGLVLLVAFYWHVWNGFRALGSNAYLTPVMRGFFQGACAALLAFLRRRHDRRQPAAAAGERAALDRHRHDVRPAGAEAGELNAQRGDGAPGHCKARPA